MSTFKGRVLFIGSVAILLGSVLLLYSLYKINYLDELIEKDKRFYVPVAREISGLEGLFQAYQYNINKIISEPAKYSPYEIQNSPLKTQIDGKIEKISQSILSFYASQVSSEARKYIDNIDNINKTFRNYNLAATAIVEAFASENKENNNQEFFNINEFVTIIKDSETTIFSSINILTDAIDERIVIGSVNTRHHFNRVISALFVVWFIYIAGMAAMMIYSKRVSDYILQVAYSAAKVRGDQFNPEDVSNGIPVANETELFELADKVTRLAKMVYEDTSGYKNRISYLENDNSRHKIITTYTTAILNSINVAVLVTDNVLRASFVNAEFEKIWKIKRSSVVDTDIADLPFVRMVDGWKDSLAKIVTADEKAKDLITFKGEFKISAKAKRNLEFQIMPLMDQTGKKILGTLTLVKEIQGKR